MTFLPLKGAYSLTIRHLTIFLTVAQQGSMSAAAKTLYLSQPTVSQAIRELETHYNGLLFERLGKKLYLTDRGRLLLPHAEELVQQFRQVEELDAESGAVFHAQAGLHYHSRHLPDAFRGSGSSKMFSRDVDLFLCEQHP